ncbi:olfactory receptor 14I1 [Leuresthes tenuis]|uniref:olfactory receptor 14I1 n=1 Tax=Leuresthes tenuis TaxID=355514 RepID=UPI003B50086D
MRQSDDPSCQPRFFFCKNLILSNLMQTATFGPAVIYSLVQRRAMAFSYWCYLQCFVGTVSILSSLVTMTCMTLERYLYICMTFEYEHILSQKRLRQVLTLSWVYCVSTPIINMILLLHNNREEKNELVTMGLLCENYMTEQPLRSIPSAFIFRKVIDSITILLCLIAHAFSYYRMYKTEQNLVMPFKATSAKARITVAYFCGMLLVQLLPVLFKVILDVLWEFQATSMIDTSFQSEGACKIKPTPTAAALHLALQIMLLVPPSINLLVYGVRNVEIRQALTNLFRRRANNRAAVLIPLDRIRVRHIVNQNHVQAG